MTEVDDVAGDADVFVEVELGTVEHDVCVAEFCAVFAVFGVGAVVEVEADGHGGLLGQGTVGGNEHLRPEELGRGERRLDDYGRISSDCRVDDGFHLNDVGDVEGADGVAVVCRMDQHLLGGDNRHRLPSS